jgi:RNA polymerase sigma-70 factor (ECF subfamily)
MKMKKDKKEFAVLLEENKGIIHKISFLYTQNPADKADLFQDICMQLWRSYQSFRNDSQFSTWLYRVALNTAISQVRKKKILDKDEYIDLYYHTSSSERNERSKLLFRAIACLNKIDRALILLWLEEKKYEEIAEILGISKSNVSVKLVRIKEKLSKIIKSFEK